MDDGFASPVDESLDLSSVDEDALEVALGVAVLEVAVPEEDGGVPILMFLIVNFPDAFPLSPKRTRMYESRCETVGTVISARPVVMGKPFANGWSRSKCSLGPSASSKNPSTIIPLLLNPGGMTDVSHVTL